MTESPKMEVRNLNAWFRDNHVLKNVSLSVPARTGTPE